MQDHVYDQLGKAYSCYVPTVNQYSQAGRPDLEFTIGELFTFYAEMKSPTGKPKKGQLHWIKEQNLKHPLKPAVLIYGKSGVDEFMRLFKHIVWEHHAINSYPSWYTWCHNLHKDSVPTFK